MAGYYYSDPVNTSETNGVSYTYDVKNRLVTAATNTSTAWGYTFGYDRYANLSSMTVTQGSAPGLCMTVNGNNQITSAPFTYDAEGRYLGSSGSSAVYNALGQNVYFMNSAGGGEWAIDLRGQNLGLYTLSDSSWTDYYVYLGGASGGLAG